MAVTVSVLLVLRRVPRTQEFGPSELQHLLGVGSEDSEWGTSRFEQLANHCSTVCGSSMHSRHVLIVGGLGERHLLVMASKYTTKQVSRYIKGHSLRKRHNLSDSPRFIVDDMSPYLSA